MSQKTILNFIDHDLIERTLEETESWDQKRLLEAVEKSRELSGISFQEIAGLLNSRDPVVTKALFEAARYVKDTIYGDRLVLFAPLYISNLCKNDCAYCAFRVTNRKLTRKALTPEEISHETEALVSEGHKRLLLVAGESFPAEGFDYVLNAIDAVYKVHRERGNIRRVNINVAPLAVEQFRRLKAKGIGTYQLFQETYHMPTYKKVHLSGPKTDYLWRLTAMDRAFEAGIDDLGIGLLFGLYDFRFEVLATMLHVYHLEKTHGVGPHTISVPRMEPADGSDLSMHPPHPVSDEDFMKIIAIFRIAVPYTGIILSTRETPKMRRDSFALGVSQISAGSRTNPGGYSEHSDGHNCAQFSLGDHRSLDEVIQDVAKMGYVPSFCTACYRLGRTGQDFMDLAKPGMIKYHCGPNALSTFMEYLQDYASPETRQIGEKLIEKKITQADDPRWREIARELVEQVRGGQRDCFI